MPRHNQNIPHQPFRFSSACKTKRRFVSKELAASAADDQMITSPKLELTVYKCELCGGWHLTNKRKKA